jgi:methyl-accepting chemotaxis protein WspA
MRQLAESTGSISSKLAATREKADSITQAVTTTQVVTTTTQVAGQANPLSTNAAGEAEKAGERGRGFLVVAREARRLAGQAAVATLDIESRVRLTQGAVSAGVMQMDQFGEEVRPGVGRVAEVNGQTHPINTKILVTHYHLTPDRLPPPGPRSARRPSPPSLAPGGRRHRHDLGAATTVWSAG